MKFYTIEGEKKSIFKVFAIYYSCMAVFCLIRVSTAIKGLYADGIAGDIIYTLIIQLGVLFLMPFLLYSLILKIKPKQVFEHCNFSKINVSVVLISFGIGILCFFINIAVSSLFNGILVFSGYSFGSSGGGTANYSTWNFFLQIFLVDVCPALCEEFLHRGILLQGIKHAGFKKSIVISALLFALMHFNIQQVSYAFVIGLILGFVSVVAKNIWPAIIIHFVNNSIATYIDFAEARGWWLGDILDKFQQILLNGNSVLIFICACLFMIGIVCLLILLIWLLYKQTIIRKVNKAINKAYDNFSIFSRNKPIRVTDEQEVIVELLEKNTLLNLDFKTRDNPIDIVLPKEKSRYKTSQKDKIFLWGSIVLGAIITIFTYTWGLF